MRAKSRGAEVIVIREGKTHYFDNRRPHCLGYTVDGEWEFAIQEAAVRTPDRRRLIGVSLVAMEAIASLPGKDAVDRVAAGIQSDVEKSWGRSLPSTSTPFPARLPGAILLQFEAVEITTDAAARVLGTERLKVGQLGRPGAYVIVPFGPGAIMIINVLQMGDARQVLDTLEVTEDAQCWYSTLRERFPSLRWKME